MMLLRGKVAIVAGASGAIGAATCSALAEQGVNVVLAALDDAMFQTAVQRARTQNVSHLAVATDLCKRPDIDRLIAKTLETYGRIDILINAAGIGSTPAMCDSSDAELEEVIRVNLLGPARLMHAVLPTMKAQRSGSIVNVGSIAGEAAVMGMYSASKFGLRGLNDSLRREVKSFGIDVTLIEPGFIRSAMNAQMSNNLPGPEIVAKAILDAIRRPRRTRIIPPNYILPTLLARSFPALTDAIFGNARIQKRLNRDARAARSANVAEPS
ncbi:MAG: SDR family NAD(P)-dependent oxidoreductase [Candidatus Eremiobacteraeota bacterium]|nr:SDR family NAD(P)-dependent oxidoreductase [Candidatus Eremiobacteraeota bacterium]